MRNSKSAVDDIEFRWPEDPEKIDEIIRLMITQEEMPRLTKILTADDNHSLVRL